MARTTARSAIQSKKDIKLAWVGSSSTYIYYHLGRLGMYTVFKTFQDGTVSRGDDKIWKLNCTLPGIKDYQGHFVSLELAKECAEKVFAHWIKNTGIQE